MTTQELNRDIKRLQKTFEKMQQMKTDDYFSMLHGEFKKEFMRVYRADSKFKYINRESILILLRINLSCRFVALHSFGLDF
jgi:hypothetical protein